MGATSRVVQTGTAVLGEGVLEKGLPVLSIANSAPSPYKRFWMDLLADPGLMVQLV